MFRFESFAVCLFLAFATPVYGKDVTSGLNALAEVSERQAREKIANATNDEERLEGYIRLASALGWSRNEEAIDAWKKAEELAKSLNQVDVALKAKLKVAHLQNKIKSFDDTLATTDSAFKWIDTLPVVPDVKKHVKALFHAARTEALLGLERYGEAEKSSLFMLENVQRPTIESLGVGYSRLATIRQKNNDLDGALQASRLSVRNFDLHRSSPQHDAWMMSYFPYEQLGDLAGQSGERAEARTAYETAIEIVQGKTDYIRAKPTDERDPYDGMNVYERNQKVIAGLKAKIAALDALNGSGPQPQSVNGKRAADPPGQANPHLAALESAAANAPTEEERFNLLQLVYNMQKRAKPANYRKAAKAAEEMMAIADHLNDKDRYKSAIANLDSVQEILLDFDALIETRKNRFAGSFQENKPSNAGAHILLGDAYFGAGRHNEALKHFQLALDLTASRDTNQGGNIRSHIGRTLNKLGRKQEAEQMYRTAFNNFLQHTGKPFKETMQLKYGSVYILYRDSQAWFKDGNRAQALYTLHLAEERLHRGLELTQSLDQTDETQLFIADFKKHLEGIEKVRREVKRTLPE